MPERMQGASPDSFFTSWLTSSVTAAVRITTFGSGYAPSILISTCMVFHSFLWLHYRKNFPPPQPFFNSRSFSGCKRKKSRGGKTVPACVFDFRVTPLALPPGELSPQVTERASRPGFPSPSSLRSATSPKERGKGVFCQSTARRAADSVYVQLRKSEMLQ